MPRAKDWRKRWRATRPFSSSAKGLARAAAISTRPSRLYDLYGPERLRDTPISERGFTGLCIGAAASGARPVVDSMFIDFLTDAFGDMFNQMSKLQWMSGGIGWWMARRRHDSCRRSR
jgi:hypothetical protein